MKQKPKEVKMKLTKKQRVKFYKDHYREMSYNEMAEPMGFKTGEGVRTWAKRSMMPNKVINSQSRRGDGTGNGMDKLAYEISYWKKIAKEEKEKRFGEEKLIEELKECLSVVKPVNPYKQPKSSGGVNSEQEAVLLMSDCQIGEKIDKAETGFADYNIDIFAQRLERLFNSVVNIIQRHKKDHPIKKLNILMLGDIVEGWEIFRGQANRIDKDVVEQVFRGQELIANFISSLSKHFEEIKIPCVIGNHGRVGQKDENLSHTNWDYIIYRNLVQIMSRQENVHFDIEKMWWKIVQIQGWKFYMEHGDRIKKYMSIPWYSIERMDNRLLKMLRMMGKDYDYIVIGHHHVPFECDANAGERFCNGTFSSGNPYAMRDLKTAARPTQKLFGVHQKMGVTWRYNIRLDK